MSKVEPTTSVSWNGIIFTAHANSGARFGTGTGDSADKARAAAIKDLEKDPDRTAPEEGGVPITTAAPSGVDPDKIAGVRAGRTGG